MLMRINNVVTKGKFNHNFNSSVIFLLNIFILFFSVVEFASLSDMKTAIEKLDDTELNGRRIRLVEDRRGGRSGKKLLFLSYKHEHYITVYSIHY